MSYLAANGEHQNTHTGCGNHIKYINNIEHACINVCINICINVCVNVSVNICMNYRWYNWMNWIKTV